MRRTSCGRVIVSSLLPLVAAAVAGCEAEESGSALGARPEAATSTPIEEAPTSVGNVDASQVRDCVDYTQFAAYLGDVAMLDLWNSVGQDVTTLATYCEDLGQDDPVRLQWFSDRQLEAEQMMAAAAATTTLLPVTAPPTTTPPTPSSISQPVVPLASVPAKGGCDPNYSGACVPISSDVDCAGGSGNGPDYVAGPVYVVGEDIYGLDGNDNDGVGCE